MTNIEEYRDEKNQKYCECGEPIKDHDDMCLECYLSSNVRIELLRKVGSEPPINQG